jgi:hypothetical protein
MRYFQSIVILLVFLAACTNKASIPMEETNTSTPSPNATTSSPTLTLKPIEMPVPDSSPTATHSPDSWKGMPIVPDIPESMVEIFQRGLARGRDPNRFSKIGDCQNIVTYFLAAFDNPNEYLLGSDYAYLQSTIDHFSGSWSRQSLAVKSGMNVAAVQNPFWTLTPRPDECNKGETPLVCEIRVNNPSIVIISMEESWSGDIGKYDSYMRKIVEYVLSQDVVPILATRAEEPDPKVTINNAVARIAYDYQVPLWNFWAAAYPLPAHGLTTDEFHLTWAAPFFDDPERMKMAWPWRNLTALQVIDAVYRALNGQP